jgi:protein subunit release factor A
MKVVIFKSYLKKSTVYFNYGDDCDETWHNFNAVENVREVTNEEFVELKNAINYFNSKGNREYTLGLLVVIEDEELDSLLTDFKAYEKKEIAKAEKLARERKEKELAAKAKAEAKKFERTVKKLAKELSLSEDEVRARLMK